MAATKAEEIEVAGRTVRLTSADKVYFPERGFTKGDVFRYYLAVGEGIMRALRERPTTLQRFPDGLDGETFFQKRIPTRGVPPWVETATIKFPSMRTADELCPTDLAHVAWAAQLGTIVFHPWPVRRLRVLPAGQPARDGVHPGHLGRADPGGAGRLRPGHGTGPDRRTGRSTRVDRRRGPRPDSVAGVGRAGRARRTRRHAVPAGAPEDAGRADAGTAEQGPAI